MDVYEQIASRIIAGQETIIGPVAIEQAQRVSNLALDWPKKEVHITGDNEVQVLETLIEVYKELFGQISVEVSREAAASLLNQLPADRLPAFLK